MAAIFPNFRARHLNVGRLLGSLVVILSVVRLVEIIARFASSCPFIVGTEDDPDPPDDDTASSCMQLAIYNDLAKLVSGSIAAASLGILLWRQVLSIYKLQTHRFQGRPSELESEADIPGSWVFAASPVIFRDTLTFVRGTNALFGMLSLPIIAGLLAVEVVEGSRLQVSDAMSAELLQNCGDSDLCYVALVWGRVLETAITMFAVLFAVHLLSFPVNIWSKTMVLALKRTGQEPALKGFARLPYFTVAGFLLALCNLLTWQLRTSVAALDGVEAAGLLAFQAVCLTIHAVTLWHSHILRDTASFLASELKSRASCKRRGATVSPVPANHGTDTSGTQPCDSGDVSRWIPPLMLSTMLLYVSWCDGNGNSLVKVAGSHSLLMITLSILALQPGRRTCTFEDLEQNPGFGLVANAQDLSRALRRLQSGCSPALTKPLRLYKATASLMQDTMAVSYRWQSSEVELGEGLELNMNDFQIQSLETAIQNSGASYVWLDRLSVPQTHCHIKFVLLARMMAVYSAARSTVAIPTLEKEGSRYYQRVWTCQEFCTARHLQTMQEQAAPSDEENWYGIVAVANGEDQPFWKLRQEYQKSASSVVPMWLRQPGWLTREVAMVILDQYEELSVRLNSSYVCDKVRALLPLLSLTPVEDHRQLADLVLKLSETVGEDLPALKEALLDSHISTTDKAVNRFIQAKVTTMRNGQIEVPRGRTSMDLGSSTGCEVKVRPLTDPDTQTSTRKSSTADDGLGAQLARLRLMLRRGTVGAGTGVQPGRLHKSVMEAITPAVKSGFNVVARQFKKGKATVVTRRNKPSRQRQMLSSGNTSKQLVL